MLLSSLDLNNFILTLDLVLKGLPKPVKQLLVLIKPLLSIPNKHSVASFAPVSTKSYLTHQG